MKWNRPQKCKIPFHYYTDKNCVYTNLHLKGFMLGSKSIIQGEERKQWITQRTRDSSDWKICRAAFLTDGSISIFQENKTMQNKDPKQTTTKTKTQQQKRKKKKQTQKRVQAAWSHQGKFISQDKISNLQRHANFQN